MRMHESTVEISAIVPVGPRVDDIAALFAEYKAALESTGKSFEMIFVLDGHRPRTGGMLKEIRSRGENISIIGLTRTFGEATALTAAFERARGDIIVTLPAYYQVQASEIPRLIDALATCDMAVARRWPRSGGFLEVLRRATFHRAVSWVSGLKFKDLGCSVRAMKRRVMEEISIYGDQHRFLPVLADRQGFRVVEVDLKQSPKDDFKESYQIREYAHRALDIFTVLFLVRFTKKPLRFFGMMGVVTFGLGSLLIAYLVVERIFFGQALADRPALLLASLLAVLGLQLFALGLLGELVIFTHARQIKDYQIDTIIQFPEAPPQQPSTIERVTAIRESMPVVKPAAMERN